MSTTPAKRSNATRRDAAATKERILKAGLADFGAKGYGGARTEAIANRAGCNIRMLYHYFGSKEGLYLACLERVYTKIRRSERDLKLLDLSPLEAIRKLVAFTFHHMRDNPDFVQIAVVENLQHGRLLKKLEPLPGAAFDLVRTIETILARGQAEGVFRGNVDAVQLYVSILALSYVHLSNRHTLSFTYGTDLGAPGWLAERERHVSEMVLAYLREGVVVPAQREPGQFGLDRLDES